MSDQIGEIALGAAEIGDSEPAGGARFGNSASELTLVN
jgi:hypothetical protein